MKPPTPEELDAYELRRNIRRETQRLLLDVALALGILAFIAALLWRAA